mmetsp:Transcript_7783/g.11627  ORF Transcript_7783/g.11627 Transcript_7783/m.11627 type:complete len:185 (-) Transcript_7783:63-617(-)
MEESTISMVKLIASRILRTQSFSTSTYSTALHSMPSTRNSDLQRGLSRSNAVQQYIEFALQERLLGRCSVGDVLMPLLHVAEQLREDAEDSEESPGRTVSASRIDPEELHSLFRIVWEGVIELVSPPSMEPPMLQRVEEDDSNSSLPFRRLMKLMVASIGKKVANKILKTRSEGSQDLSGGIVW